VPDKAEITLPARLLKLAPRLVKEAIRVKEGQIVEVTLTGENHYLDILNEFTLEVSRLGAFPCIRLNSPSYRKRYMKTIPEEFLRRPPPHILKWIGDIERHINLLADTPVFKPAHISEKRTKIHEEARKKITGKIQQRNVTTVCIPTVELADYCGFEYELIEHRLFSSLDVDYTALRKKCRALSDNIRKNRQTITLCSGNGSELTCRLNKRQVWTEDGRHELPAGSVFFAPQEDTVEGQVVIDKVNIGGSFVHNLLLEFKNGRLKRSKADENYKIFINQIKRSYGDSDVFAGIGIGLNPGFNDYIGCHLLDFIAQGSIYIGLGSNLVYGGNNFSDLFLRLPLKNPKLLINGNSVKKIIFD